MRRAGAAMLRPFCVGAAAYFVFGSLKSSTP